MAPTALANRLFLALLLAANPGAGGAFVSLVPLLLIFLIFYLLLILPHQRQRRKTQEMLSNLKTGDKVVTNGGIYGTVAGFRDGVVQLQVTSQVKIDVARAAIASLQQEQDGASKPAAAPQSSKKK